MDGVVATSGEKDVRVIIVRDFRGDNNLEIGSEREILQDRGKATGINYSKLPLSFVSSPTPSQQQKVGMFRDRNG